MHRLSEEKRGWGRRCTVDRYRRASLSQRGHCASARGKEAALRYPAEFMAHARHRLRRIDINLQQFAAHSARA